MRTETSNGSGYTGLLMLGAGLSLAGGVAQAAATPEYFSGSPVYGFLFAMIALAQITYGLVLFMRPWAYDETGGPRAEAGAYARPVLVGGAAGTAAVITLNVISFAVGVSSLGIASAGMKPITTVGLMATLIEAVASAVLLGLSARCVPASVHEVSYGNTID